MGVTVVFFYEYHVVPEEAYNVSRTVGGLKEYKIR